MKPLVDICILCFNQSEMTSAFLTHLVKTTEGIDYKLWVLDNASDDPKDKTVRVLKWFRANTRWWGNWFKPRYPGVQFKAFVSTKNFGYSGGNNFLARQGTAPWILFLNNDAFPEKDYWLSYLIETADLRGWDAIGPVSDRVMGIQGIEHNHRLGLRHRSKILSGFCFMVRRDVFEELGGWDEDFFMGDEDIDLSYGICDRAWDKERRTEAMGVDRDVFVKHLCSQSIGPWCEANGETVEKHFWNTHNQLIQKHSRGRVVDMWFWEDIRKPNKEKWAELGVTPNGKFNSCPGTHRDWASFIGRIARKARRGPIEGESRTGSEEGLRTVPDRAASGEASGDDGRSPSSEGGWLGEAGRGTSGDDSGDDAETTRSLQAAVQLQDDSGGCGAETSGRDAGAGGTGRSFALTATRTGNGRSAPSGIDPERITHWGSTDTGLSFGTGGTRRQCALGRSAEAGEVYCGTCNAYHGSEAGSRQTESNKELVVA